MLSPSEQLREGLAKRRREGARFGHAWRDPWAEIEWPEPKYDAAEWRYALRETKGEWQRAFESQPPGALAAQVTTLRQMREWSEHAPVERIAVLG